MSFFDTSRRRNPATEDVYVAHAEVCYFTQDGFVNICDGWRWRFITARFNIRLGQSKNVIPWGFGLKPRGILNVCNSGSLRGVWCKK